MIALNRDEAAKAVAEHVDRPNPQPATGSKEHDADPAARVAVDHREAGTIGPSRHDAQQQTDDAEYREHPPVGPVLTDAGIDVAAGCKRVECYAERNDDEHDACGTREERADSAPADYCEREIGRHGDQRHEPA